MEVQQYELDTMSKFSIHHNNDALAQFVHPFKTISLKGRFIPINVYLTLFKNPELVCGVHDISTHSYTAHTWANKNEYSCATVSRC